MKSDLRTVAQAVEAQNVDLQDYRSVTFGTGHTMNSSPSTLTGTSNVAGSETSIVLSNGNSIAVKKVTANGFCLVATSTKAASATWYYGSQTGGLSTADCSAGTT